RLRGTSRSLTGVNELVDDVATGTFVRGLDDGAHDLAGVQCALARERGALAEHLPQQFLLARWDHQSAGLFLTLVCPARCDQQHAQQRDNRSSTAPAAPAPPEEPPRTLMNRLHHFPLTTSADKSCHAPHQDACWGASIRWLELAPTRRSDQGAPGRRYGA